MIYLIISLNIFVKPMHLREGGEREREDFYNMNKLKAETDYFTHKKTWCIRKQLSVHYGEPKETNVAKVNHYGTLFFS